MDHAQKRWPGGFKEEIVEEFDQRVRSGRCRNFIDAYYDLLARLHATLAGRVDVILGDGDALEVVDYKTADDARVTSEVELQLQMYSLGLSESGRKVTRAKVIHVLDDSKRLRVPLLSEPFCGSGKPFVERNPRSAMQHLLQFLY